MSRRLLQRKCAAVFKNVPRFSAYNVSGMSDLCLRRGQSFHKSEFLRQIYWKKLKQTLNFFQFKLLDTVLFEQFYLSYELLVRLIARTFLIVKYCALTYHQTDMDMDIVFL